jgi:hypothetical protein
MVKIENVPQRSMELLTRISAYAEIEIPYIILGGCQILMITRSGKETTVKKFNPFNGNSSNENMGTSNCLAQTTGVFVAQ